MQNIFNIIFFEPNITTIVCCSVFFFLLGATVGSFLNVISVRLPKKEDILISRSHCPKCQHTLGTLDLIPLFSYIFLGGKCHYCKCKISPRYFLVEMFTGLIYMTCFLSFGFSLWLLIAIPLCSSLISLSLIDIDTTEIPDRFIIFNLIISYFALFFHDISITDRLIGAFAISVPLFLIYIFNDNLIGFADIKLFFSFGLILGWQKSILSFLIAIVLAGINAVILLATKSVNRKSEVPFGQFISMGAFVSLVAGTEIISFYLSLMGI